MQSALDQLLQGIQPGLTLYGVLLTFALVSFAFSRHFWRYEKELISENIERLRDLLEGFRRRHIEPIINTELNRTAVEAYEVAINGLLTDLYPKTRGEAGEFKYELVNDELVGQIIAEAALKDRLSELKTELQKGRSAEAFLSSASGKALLDDLDHMYQQQSTVARHYALARRACGRTCYAALCFSMLVLLGILHILGRWPNVILFFWLLLVIQAASYAIYSFIRLESHRRALLHMWEEFQLYGKI
jgi:hypothetical protein